MIVSAGVVKHLVELAAQVIRRADYVLANDVLANDVLANDVLRDEYGAKLGHPAQIRHCSSDPVDIIGKALERTAHVVGEEVIDKLEEVRLVALLDEYGYKNALNKALSEADIQGWFESTCSWHP